jgi:hypothetical protein
VYDHGANENQTLMFRVTVLFTDFKGKSKMDMTMVLPTALVWGWSGRGEM